MPSVACSECNTVPSLPTHITLSTLHHTCSQPSNAPSCAGNSHSAADGGPTSESRHSDVSGQPASAYTADRAAGVSATQQQCLELGFRARGERRMERVMRRSKDKIYATLEGKHNNKGQGNMARGAQLGLRQVTGPSNALSYFCALRVRPSKSMPVLPAAGPDNHDHAAVRRPRAPHGSSQGQSAKVRPSLLCETQRGSTRHMQLGETADAGFS